MVSAFFLVAPGVLDVTMPFMLAVLGIATVSRTGIMALAGIYSVDWRRLTAFDLATLFRTLVVGTLFFALVVYLAAALDLMAWLPDAPHDGLQRKYRLGRPTVAGPRGVWPTLRYLRFTPTSRSPLARAAPFLQTMRKSRRLRGA